MNRLFEGVYAVAVTPFTETGAFDYSKAKRHIDYLIENNIHGLVVMGATSEYLSVTETEHMAYVSEMLAYIDRRVPVIVGATRERPDDVIELIDNAKQNGADAAMVLPPYYCHPAQNEIVEFYSYIAEATKLPLMIYNNPGSSGVVLEKETLTALFNIPEVRLIKESSGTIQKLTEILLDAPQHVAAFCGCDLLPLESFLLGSPGWISMLANVAPRDCVALFNSAYVDRDLKKSMEIYRRLLPSLTHLETYAKPVQSLKYLLNQTTGNGGFVRRPRRELNAEEQQYVLKIMTPGSYS